jgi:hypothetical protein
MFLARHAMHGKDEKLIKKIVAEKPEGKNPLGRRGCR